MGSCIIKGIVSLFNITIKKEKEKNMPTQILSFFISGAQKQQLNQRKKLENDLSTGNTSLDTFLLTLSTALNNSFAQNRRIYLLPDQADQSAPKLEINFEDILAEIDSDEFKTRKSNHVSIRLKRIEDDQAYTSPITLAFTCSKNEQGKFTITSFTLQTNDPHRPLNFYLGDNLKGADLSLDRPKETENAKTLTDSDNKSKENVDLVQNDPFSKLTLLQDNDIFQPFTDSTDSRPEYNFKQSYEHHSIFPLPQTVSFGVIAIGCFAGAGFAFAAGPIFYPLAGFLLTLGTFCGLSAFASDKPSTLGCGA